MKKIIVLSLVLSFLFIDISCKKTEEAIIDCITESLFIWVKASVDQNNDKLVHFKFEGDSLAGPLYLEPNINWDFGDGNKVSSTNHNIDHTYSNSGTFKVSAAYVLSNGNANCSGTKEKTVTIN